MPSEHSLAALRAFVTARDWDRFHTPENLAKSIAIEASELLECYQWGPDADPQQVQDELADVVTYCIHLANRLGVDLDEIVMSKLAKTEQKYPVELNQGASTSEPSREHPSLPVSREGDRRRRPAPHELAGRL